jgi:hypothetical protein
MALLTPVRTCIPKSITPESITPKSFVTESVAVIGRVKGCGAIGVSASMVICERRNAAAKQQHTHCRNQ